MTEDAAIRHDPQDPRLEFRIADLELNRRARRACEQLGVRTVGDVLARGRREFLALPNCGPATWNHIEQRVAEFLQSLPAPGAGGARVSWVDTPLANLVSSPRALRAFAHLGLRTVADFLATPRETLLSAPGFGERSYRSVLECIRAGSRPCAAGLDFLPEAVRRLPLRRLGLPRPLRAACVASGVRRVADLLRANPDELAHAEGLGPDAVAELRRRMAELLGPATQHAARHAWNALRAAVLGLPPDDRHRAVARLGIGRAAIPLLENDDPTLERLREALVARAPRAVEALCAAVRATLDHEAGVVTPTGLAARTGVSARGADDPGAPIFLARCLAPREFYVHGNVLTCSTPAEVGETRACLGRLARRRSLPRRLRTLVLELGERLGRDVPRGLVEHLVRERDDLLVVHDAAGHAFVQRRPDRIDERLERILWEEGRPLATVDLVFHYRDRHGSAHKGRLLDHLSTDRRFLRIEHRVWSLRVWHESELRAVENEVERIAEAIVNGGRRRDVRELAGPRVRSPRQVFLVLDGLRSHPDLRYLGRGVLCPRGRRRSEVLDGLLRVMRRAMGEIPLSRFLANQPESRRRLVAHLLQENRYFVEPGPDRVDLLTNYPFNEQRLRAVLEIVDTHLRRTRGYAAVSDVIAAIDRAGYKGDFLSEHLLCDLLRRHARLEFLPGGLVARESLGLGRWIQHRAREAIRACGGDATLEDVLRRVPELAEFAVCLEGLLRHDPLVRSPDGARYCVT